MTAAARRRRLPSKRTLRRGVFLIPSLFTVANMFCGFFSILASTRGHLTSAATFIMIAGVADALDGRIARMTKTTSAFGEAYDSLADVISFGVAPALLAIHWGLWEQPRLGFAVAFLFLVAGSIRLARFSAMSHENPDFTGLPIPAGAGAIALLVLVSPTPVVHAAFIPVVVGFVLALSLLMVSNLPYRSFKDVNLRRPRPATVLFLIAIVFALITYAPVHVLSLLLVVYILSAPVAVLGGRLRRLQGPDRAAEQTAEEEEKPDAGPDPD